jgi:phosphatidylserine/phosphatidylglycerophosphate/cardiolipin synthase-like enzyme
MQKLTLRRNAMTSTEIADRLEQTLADYRLTGSERRAVQKLRADLRPDEQALAQYRHEAFALAKRVLGAGPPQEVVDWLHDIVKLLLPEASAAPTPPSEAYFNPQHDCPGRIMNLFARTRTSADVCVFTITDDRISREILAAQRRGVQVRIISDNDKAHDLGSDIDRLRAAGIGVRCDRCEHHMHHKFAIFDGAVLVNGSYNWTRSAAEHNQENFIVSYEPLLIAAFAREFESLWQRCR